MSWLLSLQGAYELRKSKGRSASTVPFFPAPSWNHLCLRKSQGGLGLVDIASQSTAFQLRAVQKICSDERSLMIPVIKALLCSATESESPLAYFVSPDFFFMPRLKYFRPHSILKGLAQAVNKYRDWSGIERRSSLCPSAP
jgi:hypothetical protein